MDAPFKWGKVSIGTTSGEVLVCTCIGDDWWFLEIKRYLDSKSCSVRAELPCNASKMMMEKLEVREQMLHISSTKVAISEVGSTS